MKEECNHEWKPMYRLIRDCLYDGTDNEPIDWFCVKGCGQEKPKPLPPVVREEPVTLSWKQRFKKYFSRKEK